MRLDRAPRGGLASLFKRSRGLLDQWLDGNAAMAKTVGVGRAHRLGGFGESGGESVTSS